MTTRPKWFDEIVLRVIRERVGRDKPTGSAYMLSGKQGGVMPTEVAPAAANAAIYWIEIIAALTIPASFIAVIVHRVKSEMGMGIRSIQFLALGTVMPTVLILALESKITGEAVAAIIGGVVGYLFTSASQSKTARGTNNADRT